MAGYSQMMIVVDHDPLRHEVFRIRNLGVFSYNDYMKFSNSTCYVSIGGDSLVIMITYYGKNIIIPDGQIALNPIQRRNAKIFCGDSISVSRFIPPENFDLAFLSVELELANKGGKDELLDAVYLSQCIRGNLESQVMTTGQMVLFQHKDNIEYIFTVNQVVLEGQDKTHGIGRGMIAPHTHIVYQTKMSSGIQIFNQREPTISSSDILMHKKINLQPFGTVNLERCRLNGIMECGPRHDHIYRRTRLLVEQVKLSEGNPLLTCLLEGPSGSGKTAMAATIAIESDFPNVKIISAGTMIGLDEATTCDQIAKVFVDAYKSPLSMIILDDIERLLGYVAVGPRFSDLICKTLLVLLKELPPEGNRVLIIGTTSEVEFLKSAGIRDAFKLTYHVPTLKTEDAKKVLQQLDIFSKYDVDSAAEALNDMPLKKLYTVVEMAAQGERGGSAKAIYSGRKKINLSHFCDCLQEVV